MSTSGTGGGGFGSGHHHGGHSGHSGHGGQQFFGPDYITGSGRRRYGKRSSGPTFLVFLAFRMLVFLIVAGFIIWGFAKH